MNSNPQSDALRSRWTLEGQIPLSGVAEGAAWRRARTITTGEDVVLFIVQGEAALEAADAVRRAYLVEDPHLLPVNDIVVFDDPRVEPDASTPTDSGDGPTTVVEYPLPSAPPLAALLAKGPLHPETARAIIGEAATGLETARRRGVRHQFLDSNRVFVDTRSGAVSLLGIGVEAAAHPGLDRSREVASFQDTAALVALLYRALTGRSPRPDSTGNVPLPSALMDTEIPEDLDLLCDLVLNETADEIPETTRGLIEALEPWQSIPVTLEAYARGGEATAAAPADAESDPEDNELESTALMSAVPNESPVADPAAASPAASEPDADAGAETAPEAEQLPDGDTIARAPRSSAPAAAGAAASDGVVQPSASAAGATGAGGVAGAAALVTGTVGPRDQETDAEQAESAEGEPAAEAPQQTSSEAKALVNDLQLDQKRSTSPFPGHLDITRVQPAPAEPEPTISDAAPAAGPAMTSPASPVAESSEAGAGPDIPSRTSGAHWPLAPTQDAPGHDDTQALPAAAPPPAAATPDYSAPTPPGAAEQTTDAQPSAPVAHAADAAPTAPVAVAGRAAPVAPEREDGPIVIHGRDRSLLEEGPEESAVPSARGSLLRDVVGVAVDKDAPATFAMGPRDREKRSLQSQWIIIGGAIAVMVALVIALTSITSDVRELLEDPLATSQPPSSAAPTEEETGEAPVEPTAEATEEPALPAPELESVELFVQDSDLEPDNTDQQERLTDGDPSTYWSTKHYGSPDYGGLKGGVGLRLQFAEPSTFTSLTLTTALNNGGTVELRALNDDGSLGDVLASGEFVADGEVRLDAPEPLETDKVALWMSELPPDSRENGRFRARIAEIQVE